LIFIFFFSIASAGEVDNFYAWEKPIKDSCRIFNAYLNGKIRETLDKVNEDESYLSKNACEDVALRIMDALGATWYLFYHSGALNTDMELWAEENPEIDRVPRFSESLNAYYKQSIYAPGMTYFGFWPTVIDVTINVNSVYFGTDKISHFLGSGYEYYKIYLAVREKTDSENRARFGAIKWGIGMENSILGIHSVRVFSYADLEANYQGLIMAIGFCQGNRPNIVFNGSKWVLEKPVDFKNFVNPNWDETFNSSAFTEKLLKEVRINISKRKLCEKLYSSWVTNRMKNYRMLDKDFKVRGFLDTSRSARLLNLSQRYQFEDLSRNEFKRFSEQFNPGFSYKELISFNEGLKLYHQKLFTPERLCNK